MEDFSEHAIKTNCPFCDLSSSAHGFPLQETNNFNITCDAHPITDGHILIVPKKHFSCIGEYSTDVLEEFLKVNVAVKDFVKNVYGSVSSFEHGVIGQTVFHSHVHILPFTGNANDVIPEGDSYLDEIKDISKLEEIYQKDGKYLFFTIGESMWLVDTALGTPRFFRDRFAVALGRPELGNWKMMHQNPAIMDEALRRCRDLQARWQSINI
jgi:diadenosine tetraphosphate (Ap4A) HIT family hydrolase